MRRGMNGWTGSLKVDVMLAQIRYMTQMVYAKIEGQIQ